MRIISALALTVVLFVLGTTGASAENTRPCVAMSEIHGVQLFPDYVSLSELEKRWDVTSKDRVYGGEGFWYYKKCGKPMSETFAIVMVSKRYNMRVKEGDLRVVGVTWWSIHQQMYDEEGNPIE